MLLYWMAEGEEELAEWFAAEYFDERYSHWSITASGQPGVTPNANPVEARNRSIKRNYFGLSGRVPIGQFLEEGIPNAIIEFAHDLGREAICVKPSSYPSRYQLDKASRLVEKGTSTFPPYRELSNMFFVEKGRLLSKRSGQIVPYDTYVFNAGDNTW
jgi:hypothetical protein